MAHLKRQEVPTNWPIKRKGTTFVVRPDTNLKLGIPILIVLRDILKLTKDRKETEKILYNEFVRA